jgi:hypothetical protein
MTDAEGLPWLAVVDLDGVLADVRHRLPHLERRPRDWKRFFALAPRDPVLPRGREVVEALAAQYPVLYLSGRPESCRADTVAWLRSHRLPEGEVRLRPLREQRPSRVFKLEQLHLIAQRHRIAVLVDDDPLVIRDALAAGFDVLPADWMPTSPVLLEAQETDGRT